MAGFARKASEFDEVRHRKIKRTCARLFTDNS